MQSDCDRQASGAQRPPRASWVAASRGGLQPPLCLQQHPGQWPGRVQGAIAAAARPQGSSSTPALGPALRPPLPQCASLNSPMSPVLIKNRGADMQERLVTLQTSPFVACCTPWLRARRLTGARMAGRLAAGGVVTEQPWPTLMATVRQEASHIRQSGQMFPAHSSCASPHTWPHQPPYCNRRASTAACLALQCGTPSLQRCRLSLQRRQPLPLRSHVLQAAPVGYNAPVVCQAVPLPPQAVPRRAGGSQLGACRRHGRLPLCCPRSQLSVLPLSAVQLLAHVRRDLQAVGWVLLLVG